MLALATQKPSESSNQLDTRFAQRVKIAPITSSSSCVPTQQLKSAFAMADLLALALSICTSRITLGNWLLVLRQLPLLRFRKLARSIRRQMLRGELRVAEVVARDEDGHPLNIRMSTVRPRRIVEEV